MLPESSVRQLQKLRQETKGKDIGDLTSNDRLNSKVPNLQYIGNPVDRDIESYEEFAKKDSSLQTIAFKSKLVNKKIKESMKNDIQKFENFGEDNEDKYSRAMKSSLDFHEHEREDYLNDEEDDEDFIEGDDIDKIDFLSDFDEREYDALMNSEDEDDDLDDDDLDDLDDDYLDDLDENVHTFESFSVKSTQKEEKQPEYTILGKEKEPKSDPNFGYAAIKAQEIKKITDFNVIDPVTPKERPIGGSVGQFIDNDIVKGYVNRIDGKDVYIEQLDNPLVIKKFNLKDVVKIKK